MWKQKIEKNYSTGKNIRYLKTVLLWLSAAMNAIGALFASGINMAGSKSFE